MTADSGEGLIGQHVGSYRVTRLLGSGGMGNVYELVHPALGRKQALKALHKDFASRPDIVQRFFDEAKAVNVISHASIIDIHDFGELPDGRPYLLMEFLSGQSVAALLANRGALPPKRAYEILAPICSALDAAHGRGIFHRDLKPDNLFVCDDGQIKLLDFGIAKLTGAIRNGEFPTRTGDLLGTPQYMAPEQATGQVRKIDARTDVYALGAVLYELLSGRPPFDGDNLAALVIAQVKATPAPLAELRRDLSEAWSSVVERAMAKEPSERFASAGQLAMAAQMALMGVRAAGALAPDAQTALADVARADADATLLGTPGALAAHERETRALRPRTPRLPSLTRRGTAPPAHLLWWLTAGALVIAIVVAVALLFVD